MATNNKWLDKDGLIRLVDKLQNQLDAKVDKVTDKQLSTNDFTTPMKNKLNNLNNYDDTEIKNDIAINKSMIDNITSQIFGCGENIPANSNLNSYTRQGIYYSENADKSKTLVNTPYNTNGFRLEVSYLSTVNDFKQTLYPNSKLGSFYIRTYTDGIMGSWFKYQGTEVETT